MVIFVIALIICAYIIQEWTKKNALKGIKYNYTFSKRIVEPNEPLKLISTITNESYHFVPFIRMEESLPAGVKTLNKNSYIREDLLGRMKYNSSIYLTSRSKLIRRLDITFPERGCYQFHGAEFSGGDFLGLVDRRAHFQQFKEVVVYPHPLPQAKLKEVMGGFLGDVSVRRFIMEDPIMTVGTREYTGREPLKQISWKHSARTGKMMAKQMDYTTEMVVTVLLDLTAVKGKTIEPDEFENCYSAARSVCQYLKNKQIPYRFIANNRMDGNASDIQRLNARKDNYNFHEILESLGRSLYGATESFEDTVKRAVKYATRHTSTIIITPLKDPQKVKTFANMNTSVGKTIFIYGEDFT